MDVKRWLIVLAVMASACGAAPATTRGPTNTDVEIPSMCRPWVGHAPSLSTAGAYEDDATAGQLSNLMLQTAYNFRFLYERSFVDALKMGATPAEATHIASSETASTRRYLIGANERFLSAARTEGHAAELEDGDINFATNYIAEVTARGEVLALCARSNNLPE